VVSKGVSGLAPSKQRRYINVFQGALVARTSVPGHGKGGQRQEPTNKQGGHSRKGGTRKHGMDKRHTQLAKQAGMHDDQHSACTRR